MHNARALKADAEDAMPAECGNVLWVSMRIAAWERKGNISETDFRNPEILCPKVGLGILSIRKSSLTSPPVFSGNKVSFVSVKASVKVMLSEGFKGNCLPVLPQYFTSAILEGDLQVTMSGSVNALLIEVPVNPVCPMTIL
jgi:hypothetical protein